MRNPFDFEAEPFEFGSEFDEYEEGQPLGSPYTSAKLPAWQLNRSLDQMDLHINNNLAS